MTGPRELEERLQQAQARLERRPGWPRSEVVGRVLLAMGRRAEAAPHLAAAAAGLEALDPASFRHQALQVGNLWRLAGDPEQATARLLRARAEDDERRAAGSTRDEDVPARVFVEFLLGDLEAVHRIGRQAGQAACLPWAWSLVLVAEGRVADDQDALEVELRWWRRLAEREGIDTSGVNPSAVDLLELVEELAHGGPAA